jgi:predicted RNA-binding Zn-ribbon protein involved in translation (DUF1610 family)
MDLKKSRMQFSCICEKCDAKIEPTEKGNSWDIYPKKCPKCGGNLIIRASRI